MLGGFALPALAAAGTLGVVGVLFGLQCGGIDRCFVSSAPAAVATMAPSAPAAAAAEPRLVPDAGVVVAEPAPVVEPPGGVAETQLRRIDDMIGSSFAAIRADDAGWLSGAHSARTEPVVAAVADSVGPIRAVAAAGKPRTTSAPAPTSAQGEAAVAAIDALEQPVRPVPRPEPLTVTAFAETPSDTPQEVTAAAKKQLAQVAARTPVATAQARPAEPAGAAKVADTASGDTRTVAGSGVNVRSGPGKSSGKLFALAGGEKVKVGEDQHGWLKITDDQGRTGWVYKTYLD
ncbi:MAG: SH3 domain-containing protein [Devosia sp.]|uniref:SH3 domain-containing protein n=1 Tax=Devosia sp. TaxID=1871048 RepID=UPI001AD23DFA|nr:SH3 domain-containing protein [Devosia sp.]MBN9314761.1 SH3 domain-containing protein [Devosia sp.]